MLKVIKTYQLDTPCEKVIQVLRSADFWKKAEEIREEFVAVYIEDRERSKTRHIFDVLTDEHPRKLSGRIDLHKTIQTVNTKVYDARARTLSWTYRGQGEKIVEISGIYSIHAEGDITRLQHVISINVKVPLIGNRISKTIAKGFEDTFPEFEALIKQYLASS